MIELDLDIQPQKNNNPLKKKSLRPFSSNPFTNKHKQSIQSKIPRIKSSFPKLNNENKELPKFINNNNNITNEFHSNMKFRPIRPKSKYNDKIFNRYWELIETEPKTVFDKNSKKKLNLEINKDYNNKKKLAKQKQKPKLNTDNSITPIDKIMQGDRKLYKFPQINWDIKTPSRFLNHVGGINFDFSKTTRPDSSRPDSGLNLLITEMNPNFYENKSKISKKNSSRPITAMNNININNNLKNNNRPMTAMNLNKNKNRPKTAFNLNINTKNINNKNNNNNLNNITNQAYATTLTGSSNNNLNDISNNMKEIPLNVQTKLEKELKEKYKYQNEFFDTEEDKAEFLENVESEESFETIKEYDNINIIKKKYEEEEKNIIKEYPKVLNLVSKFGKMDLQNYSIKTNQADKDLLELFDRAQKTRASTLGKVGNFQYFSTYQRIGSFMNFSQHLKIEALQKIGKDIYQNRKNLLEFQSKHNIQKPVFGELLINHCFHFRDSNSLFHGFMPFEEEGEKIIVDNNLSINYDPLNFLKKVISKVLIKKFF